MTGSPDANYSLYLDLVYADGTPLWGQTAPFAIGTHDWQRRQVVVLPEKPVKTLAIHLLLRGHGGKACFATRNCAWSKTAEGAVLFDGVPVVPQGEPRRRFPGPRRGRRLRLRADRPGSRWGWSSSGPDRTSTARPLIDVTLSDTTGKDRAVTLVYAVPVSAEQGSRWLRRPAASRCRSKAAARVRERTADSRGRPGRLSRYPLAAVADGEARAWAWASTWPGRPSSASATTPARGELFLAYDIGLDAGEARGPGPLLPVRVRRRLGLSRGPGPLLRDLSRGASAAARRSRACGCRSPRSARSRAGRISASSSRRATTRRLGRRARHHHLPLHRADDLVDADADGDAADASRRPWPRPRRLAETGRRPGQGPADQRLSRRCRASSPARLLDTPWCNGAVWSMNSMPGIAGEVTDFKNKWNPAIRAAALRAGARRATWTASTSIPAKAT